ncbi:hypothetical protein BLAT2472_50225 [Burkholderia latens]
MAIRYAAPLSSAGPTTVRRLSEQRGRLNRSIIHSSADSAAIQRSGESGRVDWSEYNAHVGGREKCCRPLIGIKLRRPPILANRAVNVAAQGPVAALRVPRIRSRLDFRL